MSFLCKWISAIALLATGLLGQQNDAVLFRDIDREQMTPHFPSWHADSPFPDFPDDHQEPQAKQGIVTLHQLSHQVPGKARKELEKGERARLSNHTQEAISHYRQAILLDPEYVAARNNLALVYLLGPDLRPGLEQLEEAIKIDPHNATLFTNLTVGYSMTGQLDDAERAGRTAINLDRTGAQHRFLLGMVLVQQKKYTDEALQCFERTWDEYPLAHLLAGRILIAQGKADKAKSEIQNYLPRADQDGRDIATRWLDVLERHELKSSFVSQP